MENIAYALTKKQELTPLERPVPKAGPGEVAIRVAMWASAAPMRISLNPDSGEKRRFPCPLC